MSNDDKKFRSLFHRRRSPVRIVIDKEVQISSNASSSGENTQDGKAAEFTEIPETNKCRYQSAETSNKLTGNEADYEINFSENTIQCHDVEDSSELGLVQLGIKLSLQDVSNVDINVLMTDFVVTKTITNPEFQKVNFKFIAYAPVAFRFFRETFGISTEEFMTSVCGEPFLKIPSFSKRNTKAYVTMDNQFLMKTCSKEEADFLKVLFPGYFLNFTQHPESLLPKYFGLFSYAKGAKTVRLLIRNNLLPTTVNFQDMYHLKGSTYSKRWSGIKEGEHESYITCSGNTSLKDLDFMEHCPDGYYLEGQTYEALMNSVSRDCKMLESYRIMNYYLVLGICTPSQNTSQLACEGQGNNFESSMRPFMAFTSTGEPVYLYLGFENILQSYNFKRKFEKLAKSVVYKSSTVSISRPDIYSLRIKEFLKNSVLKRK